ncbi:MAG: magnesium/cobalt transporter CorA [Bacteroidota bacterium]
MLKKNKIKDTSLKTLPGSLKYVGKLVDHSINIKVIEFNADIYEEKVIKQDFAKIEIDTQDNKKTWLNVDGIHQPNAIQEIGNIFNLHPLLLEDVLNTNQKPKLEYYGEDILYFTMKSIEYNPYTKVLETEHVSIILGPDFLLTFQEEGTEDIFADIMVRLKSGVGKIRKLDLDYLLFSAVDLIIDNYLEVIQKIDEDLENLEDNIINSPKERDQNLLYSHKREINIMRKLTFPIREMLNSMLLYNENDLVKDNTKLYLRDAHDHAVQVVEMLDSNREMIANLMDLYLSQVSNKMNSVIKVLTIISVIFMPLTFIVGVYGMNFDYMPELRMKYGYYYIWGIMVVSTIGMLIYFKHKKWL